jgi:hypothetical protein
MLAICNFDQAFQIVNIFCSRMANKNRKMIDILDNHFWVGDHHLGDE